MPTSKLTPRLRIFKKTLFTNPHTAARRRRRAPMPDTLLTRSNHERDGFKSNPSVFGRILEGSLPCEVVYEDDQVLSFKDIAPASDLHLLIIPKRHIRHADNLTPSDLPLLWRMIAIAGELATRSGIPDLAAARAQGSVMLGFHMWPLISVYHLHMHLIFPTPVTTSCIQRLKFPARPVPWFQTPEDVAKQFCGASASSNSGSPDETVLV